ncbi:MAG: hypothetical protein IKK50_06255 [Ruminiclostridium sp.]|nr:hypothetical protein [Ruminiclostridium sp.]
MKPDTLLDAMNYIDENLLAQAEEIRPAKIRRFPRRIAAIAACLTLLLGATAFATGALDPLLAYFDDPSGLYLEVFLAAGDAVSNDTVELRLEGAIADSRTVYLVVSFLGLDEIAVRDLVLTAVTQTGEDLPFSTTTLGTYTTGKSQAISHFEDADLTYVAACNLPRDVSMEDMDQVWLTYEDLTLKVAIQDFLCPEYALEPEGEGLPEVSDLRMSAIGFSYTTTEEELYLDLLPIYADGTVYKTFNEDYGTSAGGDGHSVTGQWCSGSPLALAVLDLDDYCGLQVNGVNYYFVED